MRERVIAVLLGVIIAGLSVSGGDSAAWGQDAAPLSPGASAPAPGGAGTGQRAAPGSAGNERAEGSPLAGFSFGDKPFLLPDDGGAYFEFMQKVGRDVGRGCRSLESYGWIIKGEGQKRVDGLIGSGNAALRKIGFKLKEVKPKSVQSDDIMVFTATAKERRLLVAWGAIREGLILLICDSGISQ
ncbi:putative Secreted protein [uncultured Gammaproteobacteria bacterium]